MQLHVILEYEGVRLRNKRTSSISYYCHYMFGLRPSSGGTDVENPNGNFAKLTNGSVVGALFFFSPFVYLVICGIVANVSQ
jgi:hypothetical protein